MKLEPVSKLDKWITTTSKKIDSHFIAANYDFITIFPIFGQFGAIRNLDSGHKVYNAYIFINRKILFHKNWKKNLKILNKALILFVWVKVQMLVFCKKKKNADITKITGFLALAGIKVYFLKRRMCV